jgi:hypothetical protein
MNYTPPIYEKEMISLIKEAVEVPDWQRIILQLWIKDEVLTYNLEFIDKDGNRKKTIIWDTFELTCLFLHDKNREWNTIDMTISADGEVKSEYYFIQYLS